MRLLGFLICTAIVLFTLIFCSSDESARAIQNGDTVKVHYIGKLAGTDSLIASTEGREPITVVMGSGTVMPGIEKALLGAAEGDTLIISVPPEEGFGPYYSELVGKLGIQDFPDDFEIDIGKRIRMPNPDSGFTNVAVIAIDDDSVTLDANHPMAGKTLVYELRVLEVTE
jgi:peptidylprolyl isomerase